MTDATSPTDPPTTLDPASIVRSRAYLSALVLAALIGIPISAVAYGFLALAGWLQTYLFGDLPSGLFDGTTPGLVARALAGAVRAARGADDQPAAGHGGPLALTGLPDRHRTGRGPRPAGDPRRRPGDPGPRRGARPGGAADRHRRRAGGAHGAPREAGRAADGRDVMASAGSFAAISTLLGSPLLGAFLSWRRPASAGATLGLVVLPGLLASGIGALVFVGLDAWTGLGTFSLALPTCRRGSRPPSRRCCGRCRSASRRAARLAIRWRAVRAAPRAPRPACP